MRTYVCAVRPCLLMCAVEWTYDRLQTAGSRSWNRSGVVLCGHVRPRVAIERVAEAGWAKLLVGTGRRLLPPGEPTMRKLDAALVIAL